MSEEGEVERKVRELGDSVFSKYAEANNQYEDNNLYITKEQLKEFIQEIMQEAGETEAWSDEEFDSGYNEFDADGGGKVERKEFDAFIKRFADL